jgi:hypothetical protein
VSSVRVAPSKLAAAVVSENERYARCAQRGAVPVRSQKETTCPLAGGFEPSTAHHMKALLVRGFRFLFGQGLGLRGKEWQESPS